VEAPDGTMAASTIMWLDEATDTEQASCPRRYRGQDASRP
jgi:hypothetical protein